MKTIHTFNALHLGDNLVHLHFLRKLATAYPEIHFQHGAPDQHLAQLYPLWQDLPNLRVESIAQIPHGAHNAWRGADNHWYQSPIRNDFAAYHLRFFAMLAERMGLLSPLKRPADLLFDYPALQETGDGGQETGDILVINSEPNSGQWSGFSLEGFDHLIGRLVIAGHRVVTSRPARMSVTAIGQISQRVKCIIGCVTGPMWPTLNVWNADLSPVSCPPSPVLRIHLLDTERVEFCANTVHANSLTLVPEILRERRLL